MCLTWGGGGEQYLTGLLLFFYCFFFILFFNEYTFFDVPPKWILATYIYTSHNALRRVIWNHHVLLSSFVQKIPLSCFNHMWCGDVSFDKMVSSSASGRRVKEIQEIASAHWWNCHHTGWQDPVVTIFHAEVHQLPNAASLSESLAAILQEKLATGAKQS